MNLEPLCGFKYGTPGLGIQHLNHQAIKDTFKPDEVFPELFSNEETASKKLSKVVLVTQGHGSMEAKNILEKFSLLEEKKKRKKKRKQIFQNKVKKLEGLLDSSINAHLKKNYVKHLD